MATRSLKQLEKMNAPRPVSRTKSVSSGSMSVGTAKKSATPSMASQVPTTKTERARAQAVKNVEAYTGMKKSAVKRAAEAGSRLGYDSPAYKHLAGRLAEGEKKRENYITKQLAGNNKKTETNYSGSKSRNAAVKKVSDISGMKQKAVAQAAEAGARLGYNNPAYKDLISGLAEGDKRLAARYTQELQNARKSSKKKK